jgi:hypothetical protein
LQSLEGKKITLQNTQEAKKANPNDYKLPIQQPFLDYIIPKLVQHGQVEIFLLATLQEPKHPQDTYYSAILIKKIIKTQYPGIPVKIIKITKNPSDYNLMLNLAKGLLAWAFCWYEKVIINITSSTPAIQLSFSYFLLNTHSRSEIYYVTPGGQVIQVELPLLPEEKEEFKDVWEINQQLF